MSYLVYLNQNKQYLSVIIIIIIIIYMPKRSLTVTLFLFLCKEINMYIYQNVLKGHWIEFERLFIRLLIRHL